MVILCELKPNELTSIISSIPYMYTVWKLCNLQLQLIQKVILWTHSMKHYYHCEPCQLSLQNHLPIDINSRCGYISNTTITWNIHYNVNFSMQVSPSNDSTLIFVCKTTHQIILLMKENIKFNPRSVWMGIRFITYMNYNRISF